MFGTSALSSRQRAGTGVLALGLSACLWVVSSEVIQVIFEEKRTYEKPISASYFHAALFTVYLLGFALSKEWRQGCCAKRKDVEEVLHSYDDSDLGVSQYIPTKLSDDNDSSSQLEPQSDPNGPPALRRARSVRFHEFCEVRTLSEKEAEDSTRARLSYPEYLKVEAKRKREEVQWSVGPTARLAFCLCFLWFFFILSKRGMVAAGWAACSLSPTSELTSTGPLLIGSCLLTAASLGLTLLLSAALRPVPGDRFTLSRVSVTLVGLGGLALLGLADATLHLDYSTEAVGDAPQMICHRDNVSYDESAGWSLTSGLWTGGHIGWMNRRQALLSLAAAALGAMFVVLLQWRAKSEERVDVVMFSGFLGLFATVLAWPILLMAHYRQWEVITWPSLSEWKVLLVGSLLGEVLPQVLWLWGSFLTSSMCGMATIGLVPAASSLINMVGRKVPYPWFTPLGPALVLVSFLGFAALSVDPQWDPVLRAATRLLRSLARLLRSMVCSCRRACRLPSSHSSESHRVSARENGDELRRGLLASAEAADFDREEENP